MSAATLFALSPALLAKWLKRRWLIAQINHYQISAAHERTKASESTRNAAWYEREAMALKSELRSV